MATITGTDASDFLVGTADGDLVNGGLGNDTIRGLGGNDTLNGAEGDDDLDGGDGNDHLIGGAGADIMQGGMNSDTLEGGAGNDILRGGKGFDSLVGGDGDDTLYSGLGQDTMTGGSGADVFVVRGSDANFPGALKAPTITDFVAGTDRVAVEGATEADITAALAAQTTVDGGVSFEIAGATIVVKGTGLTSLTSANVVTEDAVDDAPVAGQTLTLTTGTDVVNGGEGNDTIIGDFTATTTVNAADQINGGAGTDTLKLFGAIANLPVGVSNVEVLNFVNPGTGNIDLTARGASSGVTTLRVDQMATGSVSTVDYKGVTLDLATLNNADVGGAVTWAANATDTTLNLELSGYSNAGAQNLTITGAAATTLNVTTDTAASKVGTLTGPATATTVNLAVGSGANLAITSLATSAAKTVNISGAGKATISGADLATTVTVDASTNTGGVAFTGEAGSTLTFKGGSGSDSVTANIADLTTADAIDGGAGSDALVIADAATLTSKGAAAGVNDAVNFESLQFNAGSSVDVGFITNGITNFKTSGNASLTATNSLSTTSYTIDNSAGNTGTVSIGNKVGELTANLTVDYGAATAAKTVAEVNFSGATNVNITSTGTGTGGSNVITEIDNVDNSVFTITGTKALTVTNAIDATTTGSKVDASGFSGKLTMTGSGKADVFILGSGGSVIDAGDGKDTITGGSGADRINVTTASSNDDITGGAGADTFGFSGTSTGLYATSTGTTDVVNITDFVAGTDKIALVNTTGAFTSVTLATQTIATAADLTAVWAGLTSVAASANGGAASAVLVTVSAGAAAGTYLYVNDSTAAVNNATDLLVDITGVTGTLATTDFVFA